MHVPAARVVHENPAHHLRCDAEKMRPVLPGHLALIEEPWFHAVLGNHELMLLNYLDYYGSRLQSRKSFPSGGGEWINEAISRNRATLVRLAEKVAALPLAVHVESEIPFNVMHGDLYPIGSRQDCLTDGDTICIHKADASSASRRHIGLALKSDMLRLTFAQHSVQVSSTPLGQLPITYVGHSPTPHVTVHESYVYIDQGVCVRPSKRGALTPPTVLDHRKFAFWLGSVAKVRGARVQATRHPAECRDSMPSSVALS